MNDVTTDLACGSSGLSSREVSDTQTSRPSGRRSRTTSPLCVMPVRRVRTEGSSSGGIQCPSSSNSTSVWQGMPIRSAAAMPRIRHAAGFADSIIPVGPITRTPSSSAVTTVR